MNDACREFKDGVCGQAHGHAPGPHGVLHLLYFKRAVQIDKVNGKAHAECVDGLTGGNPQASARGQGIASEKALGAPGAGACNLKVLGDYGIASDVLEKQAQFRLRDAGAGKYLSGLFESVWSRRVHGWSSLWGESTLWVAGAVLEIW